jgi:hypothetical protein
MILSHTIIINLPTTVICSSAVAVENEGESAVTSQENFPERPKLTFLITTCVAFDAAVYKKESEREGEKKI